MKILGIESSCDETAVAIVENGKHIIASTISSQIDIHNKYGGVVPEIASRHHCENIDKITTETLEKANLTLDKIDAIGVTYAPGLVGSLLVGINFAKGLSMSIDKPIIPVHHIKAHIAAVYAENHDLKPPFIAMVVSGGHTHIIECKSYTSFNIIGQTKDDAAGETFDKIARTMGLPYPGGKYIDQLAKMGDCQKYIFPKPKISDSKYDFSFSGLKTSVLNLVNNLKQKNMDINKADISASFQQTVSEIIGEKLISAAKEYKYKNIVIAGGVACNSHIRKHLTNLCEKNSMKIFIPSPILCTDNAIMIAIQAYHEYNAGNISNLALNAIPYLPINT